MKVERSRVRIWGRWWMVDAVLEKAHAWPRDAEAITILMVRRDNEYRRVVLQGHDWPIAALEDQ